MGGRGTYQRPHAQTHTDTQQDHDSGPTDPLYGQPDFRSGGGWESLQNKVLNATVFCDAVLNGGKDL